MVRGIGEAVKHRGDGAGLGDLVAEDTVMIVEGKEVAKRIELRRSRGRRGRRGGFELRFVIGGIRKRGGWFSV